MSGELAVQIAEKELKKENNISVIFPNGFGYGNPNGISQKNRNLDFEVQQKAQEFLESDDEAFLLTEEGDGCGDGRLVLLDYLEKCPRAKMFGGGLMMMVALNIASGNVEDTAVKQVNEALAQLIEATKNSDFKFGAHDANHCGDNDCGCGAMDRFIEIIESIFRYRSENKEIIQGLLGENFDESIYSKVQSKFDLAYENEVYSEGYSGRAAGMALKDSNSSEIRTLSGSHEEIAVVINDKFGTTLNQKKFQSEVGFQSFSVDLWRIRYYADKFGGDSEEDKNEALYGMLMYTLGTSAALTDGSQTVYGRFNL